MAKQAWEAEWMAFQQDMDALRAASEMSERVEIARQVARQIRDGDTVFINGSLLALDVLSYIPPNVHTRVVTNNGTIMTLPTYAHRTVLVTGGELVNHVLTGEEAVTSVRRQTADLAVLGCDAFDERFVYWSAREASVNEAMVENAKKTIVVAERQKRGQPRYNRKWSRFARAGRSMEIWTGENENAAR
ncbi:hypothetical protein [uncultured Dubosiella sp.]|uniref:hypothetical protein n=1 Tax=uncultured Dubosiella sp. TaxID=1937011 RepID=UPI002596F81D|nr:hypothetical protein [uncultured Dubosiella sp.]